jgi:hypothetical protein
MPVTATAPATAPTPLHTHPDLMERLRDLAPRWPLTAAYGVPLPARDGIWAVVALGTGWLARSRSIHR